MMRGALRLVCVLCVTAGVGLLVLSCSLPRSQDESVSAARMRQRVPLQKLTQLDFGRDASFALCAEPACPAATRKTLAVARPDATATPATDNAPTQVAGETRLAGPTVQPEATAASAQDQSTRFIVHFDSGSASLTAADKAVLNQAIVFARHADRIAIIGRTDNVGTNSANQVLARARARIVHHYLRARLASGDRVLTLDAQGGCCFIASNDTPEGRRQNRRVEIVFRVPEQVAP